MGEQCGAKQAGQQRRHDHGGVRYPQLDYHVWAERMMKLNHVINEVFLNLDVSKKKVKEPGTTAQIQKRHSSQEPRQKRKMLSRNVFTHKRVQVKLKCGFKCLRSSE